MSRLNKSSIIVVLLFCVFCGSVSLGFSQDGTKEAVLSVSAESKAVPVLTDTERLKLENLVLQLEKINVQRQLLAEQHARLGELQEKLSAQIGATTKVLLESHKLGSDWFLDIPTLTFKKRDTEAVK